MLKHQRNPSGQETFLGDMRTLRAMTDWARGYCRLAFGEVLGEKRFRSLPAKSVLDLWLRSCGSTTPGLTPESSLPCRQPADDPQTGKN